MGSKKSNSVEGRDKKASSYHVAAGEELSSLDIAIDVLENLVDKIEQGQVSGDEVKREEVESSLSDFLKGLATSVENKVVRVRGLTDRLREALY